MIKNNHLLGFTAIFLIGLMLLLPSIFASFNRGDVNIKEMGSLEKIIRPIMENTTIKDGNCLSYALYYQDYLAETDYILDVRRIEMAGICPMGTKQCGKNEGIPHTYLIINGYGGECILDQQKLICIQVIDEE
jgi:hypothetical protein